MGAPAWTNPQKYRHVKDTCYASKDASNKLTGDVSDGGVPLLGWFQGYHDVVIDTSDAARKALTSIKGIKYSDVFF